MFEFTSAHEGFLEVVGSPTDSAILSGFDGAQQKFEAADIEQRDGVRVTGGVLSIAVLVSPSTSSRSGADVVIAVGGLFGHRWSHCQGDPLLLLGWLMVVVMFRVPAVGWRRLFGGGLLPSVQVGSDAPLKVTGGVRGVVDGGLISPFISSRVGEASAALWSQAVLLGRLRGVTRGSGEGDRGSDAGLGALSQQPSDDPAVCAATPTGSSNEAPDQVRIPGVEARQLGRSSRSAPLFELEEDSDEAGLTQPGVQAVPVVVMRGSSP
ncbi:hypothetical protein Dimus_022424 [Dionaea muscipula]